MAWLQAPWLIADACHFELSAWAVSALIASGTTPRSACQRPKQAAPRSPGLGSFFKTLLSCGVFLRMVGPRLQPGHPKPVQQLADRPLGQRDRPARGDLRAKIGAAPAYHSIALKIWPPVPEIEAPPFALHSAQGGVPHPN